jgi:hypothetical protein
MKAVLTDEPFDDPGWIFERKLDGIRCMAHRDGGGPVRLVSRTDKDMTGQFPEVAEALEGQPCGDFVVDGELVAFQDGITSFSRLQRRAREQVSVFLYVFDLLRLEGRDVRDLPLRERKALVRGSLKLGGRVRYSRHRNEHGTKLFREACSQGLEGLIAKRADSPYRSAARSRDWLKLKCHFEQELVIGGFTDPEGERRGIGDPPAPDQTVAAIGADVILVAELGNRQVDHWRLTLARLRLGGLDRPAGIAVLLTELRRAVLPVLRHASFPDRPLLGRGVALLGRRDDGRVDQLPRHGEITGGAELPVEQLEQPLDRAGPGQRLAERPDGVGVGNGVAVWRAIAERDPVLILEHVERGGVGEVVPLVVGDGQGKLFAGLTARSPGRRSEKSYR